MRGEIFKSFRIIIQVIAIKRIFKNVYLMHTYTILNICICFPRDPTAAQFYFLTKRG